MNREQARRGTAKAAPCAGARLGFTLAEMLVTITIIGILASIVLGALGAARTTAKVSKTKALIARLDAVVLAHYDSYRTRRVSIPRARNPRSAAERRLNAVRDLMRMEMPERWYDVKRVPQTTPTRLGTPFPYTWGSVPRPALSSAYLRQYERTQPSGDYDSAECLYMIVAMNHPEAKELFRESEIGDVDNDGWPEFADGWGNPIKFLRWAPAFNDSDIQANIPEADPSDQPAVDLRDNLITEAVESDHDPFDTRVLDRTVADPGPPPKIRGAWRLMPLIYSAGPDGIYDISHGGEYEYTGDPYVYDSDGNYVIGRPVDSDNTSATATEPANGSLDHYDNIHNHRIEAR